VFFFFFFEQIIKWHIKKTKDSSTSALSTSLLMIEAQFQPN